VMRPFILPEDQRTECVAAIEGVEIFEEEEEEEEADEPFTPEEEVPESEEEDGALRQNEFVAAVVADYFEPEANEEEEEGTGDFTAPFGDTALGEPRIAPGPGDMSGDNSYEPDSLSELRSPDRDKHGRRRSPPSRNPSRGSPLRRPSPPRRASPKRGDSPLVREPPRRRAFVPRPPAPPPGKSIASPRFTRSPRRHPAPQYRPPSYRVIDPSSGIQKLKARALQHESLADCTETQLEELLFTFGQDRKRLAAQHKFKEGFKTNEAVDYVDKVFLGTRKVNAQRSEQAAVKEMSGEFKVDCADFDKQTKEMESDLLKQQQHQREELAASHARELDEFDKRWKSVGKRRMYNRASNHVTILRRQLAFMLVQGRFRDAEEVNKLVEQATKFEEAENTLSMQKDFDEALKKLQDKQASEVGTFEAAASVQRQRLAQDRAVARKLYDNRGKKLAAREEIAADRERLWNRQQSLRIEQIVHRTQRPFPSTKMTRADIKDRDCAILTLPLVKHRRPSPATTRQSNDSL
jgi:hypothetical protein